MRQLRDAYDPRAVVRPTMVPDRDQAAATGGSFAKMLETDFNGPPAPPPREPITVVEAVKWKAGNDYTVGSTVYFNYATFAGGDPDQTVTRWRLQKRATPDDAWTNYNWTNYTTGGAEWNVTCPEGQMRIQCQARDASVDPVEQVNSFTSVQTVAAPPDPLSASKPTLTGDPCVGYTLTCSEPVPAGGVPPYTFNYFWVDVTRDERMAPTTVVTDYDLGKQMKCLVTVSDSAGETVQVETAPTIQVFRPTLGDFQTYVDNVLIDQTTIGVTPSQICACLVQEDDPVLFPPKDMSFNWEIRSGTGRLSGDNGTPFIGYVAPDTAPAGALVTCSISSTHAQDVQSCQFEFLTADGP